LQGTCCLRYENSACFFRFCFEPHFSENRERNRPMFLVLLMTMNRMTNFSNLHQVRVKLFFLPLLSPIKLYVIICSFLFYFNIFFCFEWHFQIRYSRSLIDERITRNWNWQRQAHQLLLPPDIHYDVAMLTQLFLKPHFRVPRHLQSGKIHFLCWLESFLFFWNSWKVRINFDFFR
jgi:hypothetical protein